MPRLLRGRPPRRLRMALALAAWAGLAVGSIPGGARAGPRGGTATQGLDAVEASAEACAFLGDRLRGHPDTDLFELRAGAGERVQATLASQPDPRNRGRIARLAIRRPSPRGQGDGMVRVGPPPLAVALAPGTEATVRIEVTQIPRRTPDPRDAFLRWLRRFAFEGEYCLRVRSDGQAASTLAPTGEVEVQWVALESGASELPPFGRATDGTWSGRIQPELPLREGGTYGVVLTTGIRAPDGRALRADADFAALLGVVASAGAPAGPAALYTDDVENPANPFPDARLVRTDGTIALPDRVALRGLDEGDPELDLARASLRAFADEVEQLRGFSAISPVRVALSEPVDLASVTPETALFFERTDGALDLAGLVAEAARHGVGPDDIALAISFPVQPVEDELRAVRARLLERDDIVAGLEDPDPDDDLPLGVFVPGGPPGSPFADFLDENPGVAAVVAGLLPSPEFRGDDGLFDSAVVAGTAPADVVELDFRLVLPAGFAPPHPVVIAQHGFGGSNAFALDVGPLLASRGLATIAISAVSHGRRGAPTALISSTPLEAREIFRQSSADQMALVRAVRAGIDVDGDGLPDLDGERIGYLGVSLGGLIGGLTVSVEDDLGAAVLNVTGGRIAQLGQAPGVRALTQGFLAGRVRLAVGSPKFETYLSRLLELGELAENPADALVYAHRWRRQPRAGSSRRRVLVQEGIGDDLVLNAFTEELAAAARLPADTPAEDPDGVAGHWVFDPPGGHGIFARDDVREQALVFLESHGTRIVDPTP